MKRSLIAALIFGLVLSSGWVPEAKGSSAPSSGQAPLILSLLSGGELLDEDGMLWLRDFSGALSLHTRPLGVREASGSSHKGIGFLPDGTLAGWNDKEMFGKLASASDVKMTSGSYWLKPDGSVRTFQSSTGKPEQVQALSDVAAMAFSGRFAGAVKTNGEILYMSDSGKPVVWGQMADPGDVAEIQVADSLIAILLRNGKVILYNLTYFETNAGPNYLLPIPVAVASDAARIALVDDRTLIIVRKDGSVALNDPFQTRDNKISTSELTGLKGIEHIVPASGGHLFYARLKDGSWIAYDRDGTTTPVTLPSAKELAASLERTKLLVGESLKPSFALKFDNGKNKSLSGKELQISIEKPHLLKRQEDGTWKALAVGETAVTVAAAGLSKTLKIAISQSKPLQGGKTSGGVTMLPMKTVFQALGGKIAADTAAKAYTITVGNTQIKLKTGSKIATVNGKKVTMKAAVITEKGQTYFSADLLSAALGAKLAWKSATQTLNIAFGQASMSVSTYQPGQSTKTASGLYTVPGTGKYAGYQLLKGHPYESSTAIYFKRSGPAVHSIQVDVRKVDLNRKVTWTDPSGVKRTNTVGELRRLFANVSNQYTDEWLLLTFGDVYIDYFPVSVPAERLIDQYLRETGQIE